jgi:hypothetical protein
MFKIYGNWPRELLEILYCQHNAGCTSEGRKGQITCVNIIMHTSFFEHLIYEKRREGMEREDAGRAK